VGGGGAGGPPQTPPAPPPARDRTACGPVAPPDGLYLMRVEY
jgi:hypothetical protein